MADLAIPTGCVLTVGNVVDRWQRGVGSAPDTSSSSPGEQSFIGGIHKVFYEGLERLDIYGYSDADALLAMAGSLLSASIDGALCWALRDSAELDSSREQVIDKYCQSWSDALNGAQNVARAADGTKLLPDPSASSAAAHLQAQSTSRNGIDAPNHEFEFDVNFGQFHGNAELANRYAAPRYGNRRGGAV